MIRIAYRRYSVATLIALLFLIGSSVFAQGPTSSFRYQWAVSCQDADGLPLASGDIEIRIYDAATGGTEVYNSGSDFVGSISDGSALLCFGCSTPAVLSLSDLLYLEMSVNDQEVIGDANVGRVEFYASAGDHSRDDLDARLDALESAPGVAPSASSTAADRRPARTTTALAGGKIPLSLTGLGGASGSSTLYSTAGNFLAYPIGSYSNPLYIVFIGPYHFSQPTRDCCVGRVGDANQNGEDEPTIGDISLIVDAKFITGTCVGKLECLTEADVNQSGGKGPTCDDISIGDISLLVDYLFITGPTVATLNDCL